MYTGGTCAAVASSSVVRLSSLSRWRRSSPTLTGCFNGRDGFIVLRFLRVRPAQLGLGHPQKKGRAQVDTPVANESKRFLPRGQTPPAPGPSLLEAKELS